MIKAGDFYHLTHKRISGKTCNELVRIIRRAHSYLSYQVIASDAKEEYKQWNKRIETEYITNSWSLWNDTEKLPISKKELPLFIVHPWVWISPILLRIIKNYDGEPGEIDQSDLRPGEFYHIQIDKMDALVEIIDCNDWKISVTVLASSIPYRTVTDPILTFNVWDWIAFRNHRLVQKEDFPLYLNYLYVSKRLLEHIKNYEED